MLSGMPDCTMATGGERLRIGAMLAKACNGLVELT
jgi:hypothetical protein